ncbi:hypothetical protein [Nannocystis radixulma]|uniref:Uncharacterized protein n=1 Tax=Nannocystis radixulma TaxID=2995305 RepID=A0ABT5AYS2_9BACT|nr:hypothetical protein [Nannocystis radixulma]MDC0666595.1 hypothetical protein [Nannocystis radixulma]
MARGELPLCTVCGTWSPGGALRCGHPPDARLTWLRPPWSDGLRDFLGMAAFTLLCAAVLLAIGPLLWWIFATWPPESPLDIAGAIGVGLVSLPSWVFGIGIVLAIPEHWRGRCWRLHDARAGDDDRATGFVVVRGRGPVRGDLVRTIRAAIPEHDCSDMSSTTAAQATGDPQLVVAAPLAGLAARGHIALTLVDTSGWTLRVPDPPLAVRSAGVHVRSLSLQTAEHPWLERLLLDQLEAGQPVELRQALRALLVRLAREVGYFQGDGDRRPYWPTDAGNSPSEALRALLLDDPSAPVDPAPVRAVLAAWRARDPARVGPVLELVAGLTSEQLPAPPAARA